MLHGVEINNNNIHTETLVTHKSLKFKKIIKEQILLRMISVSGKKWEQKKINQNIS